MGREASTISRSELFDYAFHRFLGLRSPIYEIVDTGGQLNATRFGQAAK
jgi:hypothetical protein